MVQLPSYPRPGYILNTVRYDTIRPREGELRANGTEFDALSGTASRSRSPCTEYDMEVTSLCRYSILAYRRLDVVASRSSVARRARSLLSRSLALLHSMCKYRIYNHKKKKWLVGNYLGFSSNSMTYTTHEIRSHFPSRMY